MIQGNDIHQIRNDIYQGVFLWGWGVRASKERVRKEKQQKFWKLGII